MITKETLLDASLKTKIAEIHCILSKGFPTTCVKCGALHYYITPEQSREISNISGMPYDYSDLDPICLTCLKKEEV